MSVTTTETESRASIGRIKGLSRLDFLTVAAN